MNRLDYKKVFYHTEKLKELKDTGDTWPVHMQIGLTSKCNHRCIFCFGGHAAANRPNPDEIDVSTLLKFLGQAKEHGLKAVTFVGRGEPLLYPHIDFLLSEMQRLGIEIGIFSNGALLDEERCKFMAEYATFIRFSVNGCNEHEHERVHQKNGDFPVIVGNIKRLLEMRKNNRVSLPTVGVQMVVYRDNYKSIIDATRLWKSLGVDYFEMKPLILPQYQVTSHFEIADDKECVQQLMNEAKELQDDNFEVYAKFDMYSDSLEKKLYRPYKKCLGQSFAGIVTETGELRMCNGLYGKPVLIGSIYENSFEELWLSEERKNNLLNLDTEKCGPVCRFHFLNKILWDYMYPKKENHPNFI